MVGGIFATCWHKIGRADEISNALKAEILDFVKTEPYASAKKVSADGRRHSIAIHIKNKPSVERWALFAGDAIHNLRSALDHMVYAVACHETKKSLPPSDRTLAFPIVNRIEDWASAAKRRIDPIGAKVRSVIERVQPYNRFHGELPPLLSLLRDFDDADKHRLLNIVVANVQQGKLSFSGPNIPNIVDRGFNLSSIDDDTEIAYFVVDSPQPDLKYNYEMSIPISIAHPVGRSGRAFTELAAMLDFLRDEVTFVVNEVGGVVV